MIEELRQLRRAEVIRATGAATSSTAELNLETCVSAFFHLARNPHLPPFRMHGQRLTTRHLYVGSMQEFGADSLHTDLEGARMGTIRHLEECLAEVE